MCSKCNELILNAESIWDPTPVSKSGSAYITYMRHLRKKHWCCNKNIQHMNKLSLKFASTKTLADVKRLAKQQKEDAKVTNSSQTEIV